ncbi:hypothetical protein BKA59DRAFT_457226 [Fusarium tricinctum]|uniref:Zn(2)-C6 fungal-type domain-containing protein n=1 Tax=Fusarium tricinctum TaxID=61284 RepID=A0A8K0RYY6_9HYPO|nr:hypothetical protein BKA59DRAFT_457226 [Fusarium tricinctum]
MEPNPDAEPRGRGLSCDTCRARKIKCDRESPCSSCRAANVICRTTKGPLQKRQRVLISPRYEEEIAILNSRFARLEKLLQDALANSHSPSLTDKILAGPSNLGQTLGSPSFEGESSFAAHSKHTVLEIERLVGQLPYSKDGDVAVASLREIVNPGSTNAQGPEPTILRQDFTGLPLPTRQLVIKTLNYCKNNTTRLFRDYPFLHVATFTKMCQQVYFPTGECSLSAFIIVNSGLCNLFRDFSNDIIDELGLDAAEVAKSVSICAANVRRAAVDLSLALDPTFENILALLLSASTRMDWTNPSFDWKLISYAAVLCQEAGYHRLPDVSTSDEVRQERLVFWYVWGFDVMFSFNLGRSPTLPDHDITTARPRCPGDVDVPWGYGFLSWLDSIELQHEIYQQLYSGRAQAQPPEVKTQRAQVLAEKLIAMRHAFVAGKDGRTPGSAGTDTAAGESFELMFYTLLTLVYRVIPLVEQIHPLQVCNDCMSAARTALNIQNRAWERIGDSNDETWKLFIHWTLLCCPFVPFIIVFSHAIAAGDEGDLHLLGRTVASLQSAAQQSPSIAKLHHVFSTYHQVGRVYFDRAHQAEKQQVVGEGHGGVQSIMDENLTNMPFNSATDVLLPMPTWDRLLDEWNLGIGEENAIEVSSFLGNYFSATFEFQD